MKHRYGMVVVMVAVARKKEETTRLGAQHCPVTPSWSSDFPHARNAVPIAFIPYSFFLFCFVFLCFFLCFPHSRFVSFRFVSFRAVKIGSLAFDASSPSLHCHHDHHRPRRHTHGPMEEGEIEMLHIDERDERDDDDEEEEEEDDDDDDDDAKERKTGMEERREEEEEEEEEEDRRREE